uniref:Transcription factor Iwr1 domain-containing protein n=1 Tax=Globodera rostochiensis TaxID=31243 RepID=A0A914HLG8_GLORO
MELAKKSNSSLNIATAKPSLAPIAEQEECECDRQQSTSSSSPAANQQQWVEAVQHRPYLKGMPRMVRLRRKRREDPFGTLIQSTKKMRLNEPGHSQADHIGAADDGERMSKGGQNVTQMEGVLFAEDDEDQLLFYYGGQDEEGDESDADGYDDESDSNAEDYYKNEYPDEDQGNFINFADKVRTNEYENDSTSGEDNFDHYGDEPTKYRNYTYAEDDDVDGDGFIFGGMISARTKADSEDESD